MTTLTVANRATALGCVPSAVVVSPRFVLPTAFAEVLERLPRGGFLGWRS